MGRWEVVNHSSYMSHSTSFPIMFSCVFFVFFCLFLISLRTTLSRLQAGSHFCKKNQINVSRHLQLPTKALARLLVPAVDNCGHRNKGLPHRKIKCWRSVGQP